MDIRRRRHVLVNLAPFIGSSRRINESIPCNVLAIDGTFVEVVDGRSLRTAGSRYGLHPVGSTVK